MKKRSWWDPTPRTSWNGRRQKGSALLQELLQWTTQPQFVYSHRWCTNDLGMWDNRHCLHRARPFDSWNYKRIMHRTTLAGDGPTVEPAESSLS